MSKLIYSLVSVGLLFSLSLPLGLLVAEEEADYKINVRATFADQRVEGMTFDVTGNGTSKTGTSTKDVDVVFADLTAGTYTVKITFPGNSEYESADGATTKTVTLTASKQQDTVIFSLQKKAPPVDVNQEMIKNHKWPAELSKVGSITTDISKLSDEQLGAVPNFTFDNPGVNQIVYTKALNLEDYESYKGVANMADYIDLETVGKISLETDFIKPFNQEARLVMQQINLVPFVDKDGSAGPIAIIKRDGTVFSEPKDLKYEGKTLSFIVPGFSTYAISPRVLVTVDGLESNNAASNPSPSLTAEQESVTLIITTDNLDATIKATNNGELLNIESKPDATGEIRQAIKLVKGENRIRITAELANGESSQQIIKLNYQQEAAKKKNDVSKWFSVGIIVLIVGGLSAVLGFLYYRKRHQQPQIDPQKNLLAGLKTEEPVKPKYEEGLLTEEEKQLYNGTDSQTSAKPASEPVEVMDEDKPTAVAESAAKQEEQVADDIIDIEKKEEVE